MPVNNKLKRKIFPMEIKFGKEPSTSFRNNLEDIKIKLVSYTPYVILRDACIEFANATWYDRPISVDKFTTYEKEKMMIDIFKKNILPTTMENASLTFLIEGVTVQEWTHLFRQRKATFSCECTGDKFLHDKNFVVPTAIENTDEFYERYKEICLAAKQLYCDMVNSKKVNIHDARYIMPRSMENFLYMRMDLRDCMQFIYDRVDKQIQPQSDNVIAYRMMLELTRVYPPLVKILNKDFIHRKADFYIKTARNDRSSNFYRPDKDSDCFEYNENDFVYGLKRRDEILGDRDYRNVFGEIMQFVEKKLDYREKEYDEFLEDLQVEV